MYSPAFTGGQRGGLMLVVQAGNQVISIASLGLSANASAARGIERGGSLRELVLPQGSLGIPFFDSSTAAAGSHFTLRTTVNSYDRSR
jgi:hypothetical protein